MGGGGRLWDKISLITVIFGVYFTNLSFIYTDTDYKFVVYDSYRYLHSINNKYFSGKICIKL